MERHYNFIYQDIVQSEGDMVGHIAYSLYKREKISFIEEFKKKHDGRGPSDEELEKYHESCCVPQRIESYRKDATALLQNFIGISFDETSKQILSDFSKEQEAQLKNAITPLLPPKDEWPEKETLGWRYFHGIMQGLIGAILLPVLIGIILFAITHSLNDVWLALGKFFTSIAQSPV